MNAARRKKIDEAANRLRDCVDKIAEAKSLVEEIAQEERDYYDNMSDNLKNGDKGTRADEVANTLEELVGKFEEFDPDEIVGELEGCKD